MLNKSLSILILAVLVVSCAKEKKYDEVFVENSQMQKSVQAIKSLCDSSDPFLYVPSVANSPYAVSASRPYWQGEQKLLNCDLKENELQFYQTEDDPRFAANDNNKSPVLSIPVSYVDYKCTEDSYGKCTNSEQIDDDKEWHEKKYVKMEMQEFEVIEANSLPIQLSELFKQGCFTKTGQDVTKAKFEDDALNITAKVSYKAAAKCVDSIRSLADLRYLNFSIDYKYSLVKLSSIADKAYEPVIYPKGDKSTFGFFTTEIKKRTIDNHDHLQGLTKTLMNRWSPNKKKVVYNLNKEFFLPENSNVLAATVQAINSVNFSLNKAKAGYHIALEDGSEKDIGDIRNNFIILVGDPQASGVIGYGPSVANPKTGEIVNARTVMYLGTIKKFVSRTWDEIAEARNSQPTQTKSVVVASSSDVPVIGQTSRGESSLVAMLTDYVSIESVRDALEEQLIADQRDLSFFEKEALKSSLFDVEDESLLHNTKDLMAVVEKEVKLIDEMAKDTFFHASNVNFSGAVESVMSSAATGDEQEEVTRYPMWDELTEEQREGLMKDLLPIVFVPTMVHEFGHNLGLRHNFAGSRDEKNYYTAQERTSLGISGIPTYSSIMDYAHNTLEELPMLGKYDIAALKFGYAGEIEVVVEDKVIDMPLNGATITEAKAQLGKQGLSLKPYMFCTDENTSNDPLCNRFDEGVDAEGVANHYIKNYKKSYSKVNFRGRKFDMNSISGDMTYLVRVYNTFSGIRRFFDTYDQLVFLNNGRESDSDRFKSAKKAAKNSFDFFMETLEAPAYSCVERNVKTKEITKVASFEDFLKDSKLSEFGIEFDIRYGCILLAGYQKDGGKFEYFEFGKYFNNTLDLITVDRNQTSDMISQVDVRGSWIDKSMATMFLSMRMGSPSTVGKSSNGNYFDYPEFRDRIVKYSNSLLKNKVEVTAKASNFTHDPAKTDTSIEITAELELNKSHVINKSYNGFINNFFGLSENRTSFKDSFISQIKSNLKTEGVNINKDEKLVQEFTAKWISPQADEEYLTKIYGFSDYVKFSNESGDVSYKFGVTKSNKIALELKELKIAADTKFDTAVTELQLKLLTSKMIADAQYALQNEKLAPSQVSRDEVTQALIKKLHDMDARVAKRLIKEASEAKEELDSILSSFIALSK